MSAPGVRRRLACAECTRKKIKCDKVVPCRNCTRRGKACYRTPQQSRHLCTAPRPRTQDPGESTADTLESNLSTCIEELQATLQAVRQGKSTTPNFNDRAFSVPPSPAEQITQTEQGPIAVSPQGAIGNRETTEVEDAATILEFLAWGRRKVQGCGGFNPNSDGPGRSPGDVALDGSSDEEAAHLRLSDDSSSLTVLQLLLPEPRCVQRIVQYHCDSLLWYHASFHTVVFQQEVTQFLERHGCRIDQPTLDLQWVALLFAVLAGSMTCAPPAMALSWGFGEQERCTIARRWFKAALVCLNRADYTSNHSIYAVECIATMTSSAHMLGHSNSHSVMLATAVRIAQSLGLHLLGSGGDDTPNTVVRKEIGRRVWTELCIQDWFSIPFSESYFIHLLDFSTSAPMNCRDEEMTALSDDEPTSMSYHRILYGVARLMPRLQDDLAQSNTPYTKYEHVLRYDTQMRTLAKQVPRWLKNTPLHPCWPRHVPWARHCLSISSAHKIIMIHRKFLWSSFTNPAFSFTRKTCIAASKTIIRECKVVAEEDGPILWIYHAFAVAASIILCLDMLFRSPSDAEHHGHRGLVQDTITILSRSGPSMIAKRGVKILRLLAEAEHNRSSSEAISRDQALSMSPYGERCAIDIRKLVQAVCDQESSIAAPVDVTRPEPLSPFTFQARSQNTDELFGNVLGPQSRFEIHDSLEDILFLAQNCGPSY
ncbi:hypothetical protein ASPCAL12458 [Aspergillus calidoustus]|uniref:Zn(2)-C6 fungal-type domain-containing protein n=1 Tax=Aspergillus calidoustus TaxID=454130 RepID=A0A0U5GF57_ASPCI|nr:hypothetical protein ASPCAL12458 [Aspergillus calidoustus]